jgi:uncharacterized protein (UPF0548 family)
MIGFMFDWFPRSSPDDHPILDLHQGDRLNYDPGAPTDSSWHVDRSETVLGRGEDVFQRAKAALMAYAVYPRSVMKWTANFEAESRALQPRDYILQRIHVLPRVLDVITLVQVSNVIYEPRRVGFTYLTCNLHYEQGEWTAAVSWDREDNVRFMIQSVSKSAATMPLLARPWARRMQLRAHKAAITHFQTQLARQSGFESDV